MSIEQRASLLLAIMRLPNDKQIILAKYAQELEPTIPMDGELDLWAYQPSTLDKLQEFIDNVVKETPNLILSDEDLKKQILENQDLLTVFRTVMPACFLFQDDEENSVYQSFISEVGIKITLKKIKPFPGRMNRSDGCGMKRRAESEGVQNRILKRFKRFKRAQKI